MEVVKKKHPNSFQTNSLQGVAQPIWNNIFKANQLSKVEEVSFDHDGEGTFVRVDFSDGSYKVWPYDGTKDEHSNFLQTEVLRTHAAQLWHMLFNTHRLSDVKSVVFYFDIGPMVDIVFNDGEAEAWGWRRLATPIENKMNTWVLLENFIDDEDADDEDELEVVDNYVVDDVPAQETPENSEIKKELAA